MTTGNMRARVLAACIVLMMITPLCFETVSAQTGGSVDPMKLMRGKYWIKCLPNGALDRETTPNQWESLYPGDFNGQAESAGGWDNTAIYNGAIVAGQPTAWFYRAAQFNSTNIYAVTPTTVTQNYDLVNTGRAEEYLTGKIGSFKTDASGNRHMAYTLDGTVRVWSQPGYDGFIIMDCTLTNTDDSTFNDFYYARLVSPTGPYRPSSSTSGWDKEYEWDAVSGDSLGFIFYDGTSMPPTSAAPAYSIPPGDSTGDAGDPGNIGIQGSRNFKLYSPYVYAYTFDYSSLPPNKNGQKKIWRKIVSISSTPGDVKELMPSRYDQMANYTTLVNFITQDEQPRVSWRAAYDSIQRGYAVPGAGSLWERNPRYLYAIGPYTIAPGQTLRWREIFACGQMDRNISMLGGYEATRRYKREGIADLIKNWRNAVALIKGNYSLPVASLLKGAIPPPTPCTTPRTLDADSSELKVIPAAIVRNGNRIGGVQLAWRAVHIGYLDPFTRKADFAAYKIYRSNNTFEGPWTLIDSVPVAKADSLVVPNDMTTSFYKLVKYFIPAPANTPYRYCVTSIDTGKNESAMAGYTFYPVSAEPNPSNNQSDVRVVPNPFRQVSGFPDVADNKRLAFVNIPGECTIRIYTLALDLVKTLEHAGGGGNETWGSQGGKDYMLTDFAQNGQPGIYIYHIESRVPGHEGETSVGKFAVIK
ncbi:MAG: hypothetical protein NTV54_07755 [Ignavibacteriales bacterium]|nr:hypothetical protein [Ignavibacteriales bacterium]